MSDPHSTTPPDDAFCLSCGYPLRDLPTPRCPECGRAFDPTNPRTMSLGQPLRPWQRWLLRPTGWPTIALALLATGGLIYLSRWPRPSPEPVSVLLDEFHRPRPFTMPPTALDVVFYATVLLWAAFVGMTLLWQFARLVLVPSAARRAKVWGISTRRRRVAVLTAAILSLLCMIFGWQQRIGRRWMARVIDPVQRTRYIADYDPWRQFPVALNDRQAIEVLDSSLVHLPAARERLGALKVLVERHGRWALPSILHAARTETDPTLLAWELRLIGLCRDPSTAQLLAAYLEDPRPLVRAAAADAIGILRHPTYPIFVARGGWIAPPLSLNSTPSIAVGGVVTPTTQPDFGYFSNRDSHDFSNDPPIEVDASVRLKLENMMTAGTTPEERQAAPRTLVVWPPDHYRLRIAEWGVWIESKGHMALARSIVDEIPPFVHRTENPLSDFRSYFLYPSQVFKPIVHVTTNVPLAADVDVQIREGRPWFGYPKPDDFSIGTESDTENSSVLGRPAGPSGVQPSRPNDDATPPVVSLSDRREGYPWLLPVHRLHGYAGQGELPIFRLGLHWQSLIVVPNRCAWMNPPTLSDDPRYRWWKRLRDVPSSWVCSRNEAERFLYYDGPTRAAVPLHVDLDSRKNRVRFTAIPDNPVTWHSPDSGEGDAQFHPVAVRARGQIPDHEGLYIDCRSGVLRGQVVPVRDYGSQTLDQNLPLRDDAVVAQFRDMLLRYGLTGPEADGLIAAWAPQFFRAEGRRFILRMSPQEYARQCPMQVRPPPTEVVRLGLVLTEFDQQPASAPASQ